MIGISVIGTPHGLEELSIGINKELSVKSKVDLNNALINIYPKTDILRVFRERQANNNYLYFVYYRFATEMNETRSGSFYGSVVVLRNRTVEANLLFMVLEDLADVIKDECLNDESKFQRDIENLKFTRPPSVAELEKSLIKNNTAVPKPSTESGFLKIGKNQELKTYEDFIECVFQNEILSDFQTLYASTSDEVYNSVNQKRMLPLLSFSGLEEARRRQIEIQRQKELEAKRLQKEREVEAQREKERRVLEAKHEQEIKDLEAKQERERREKNISSQRTSTERTVVGGGHNEIINLRNRVIDLERKVFPERYRDPENGGIGNWFNRKLDGLTFATKAIILVGILLILGTLGVIWKFSSSDIVDTASNLNNTTQPTKNNKPSVSPAVNKISSPIGGAKIRIKYLSKGNESDIKTVRNLIDFIKNNHQECANIDKTVIDSIRILNGSITDESFKKNTDFSDGEISNYELSKINGDIIFDILDSCNLPEIDKNNFVKK